MSKRRLHPPRKYLGMWSCAVCNGRTRVWDWLPDPVLCVRCLRKLERQEAQAQETQGGSENPGSGNGG